MCEETFSDHYENPPFDSSFLVELQKQLETNFWGSPEDRARLEASDDGDLVPVDPDNDWPGYDSLSSCKEQRMSDKMKSLLKSLLKSKWLYIVVLGLLSLFGCGAYAEQIKQLLISILGS